ncbi:hypothetical protein SAMN04489860_2613 [Paraoerskovia marina]|uniref:Uncharacterized protein n=1 Tax=Paraoerskovia marina TaxID=545619 RepID=A0A1H1VUX6_9CELL|nr:hypothetical protein [Paraoerskovia marina]SDS88271.1 hypothetical protein SAMN04489860_2613 [Paraoerskovia marina]
MDDGETNETGEPWEQVAERFAQMSGLVGEVADPLLWGMDLREESLAVVDDSTDDEIDPAAERFCRGYETFEAEPFGVETLRHPVTDEVLPDLLRAALTTAIAAPLHTDVRPPTEPGGTAGSDDFADAYQDYRSAMRAVLDDVERAGIDTSPTVVDGVGPGARITTRGITAQYVQVGERALLVTGPTDLVERVDVVMRPLRNLLHDEDGPRF